MGALDQAVPGAPRVHLQSGCLATCGLCRLRFPRHSALSPQDPNPQASPSANAELPPPPTTNLPILWALPLGEAALGVHPVLLLRPLLRPHIF